MTYGTGRMAPNRECVGPINLAVNWTAQQNITLGAMEDPTELVRVEFTSDNSIATNGTNYFTLNIVKVDVTFSVNRTIATMTTNTGGTATTAGVPNVLTILQTNDATNYTSPTYPLPQPYRRLRTGDYLRATLAATGAAAPAITNGIIRFSTLDSAMTGQ
jgi:hypothetical protein